MKSKTLARILALTFCATLTCSFQAAAQSPAGPSGTVNDLSLQGRGSGNSGRPQQQRLRPRMPVRKRPGSSDFPRRHTSARPLRGAGILPGRLLRDPRQQISERQGHHSKSGPGRSGHLPGLDQRHDLVAGYSENGLLDPTTGFPEFVAGFGRVDAPPTWERWAALPAWRGASITRARWSEAH